jgi:RNA polymerase sigma-70 factor (ECF subfamily)
MKNTPQTPPAGQSRLNEINTRWSLLGLAHQNSVTAAGLARNQLVERYSGAIRRFIGVLMRDEPEADDVAQDLMIRLLKGEFSNATPERGRFRDYLAVSARNLVKAFWARKGRHRAADADVSQLPAADAATFASDEAFLATWRRSVLEKARAALEKYQREHAGSVSFTILQLRTDHPDDDSRQLASRLSEATGRPFRPEAMRQQLHRARLRFAEMLLEEISLLITDPTPERVEEELIEIGLIDYVRDFLPPDWKTRGELSEALPK